MEKTEVVRMEDSAKEIKLPSGKLALVRKGFGRDLMRAHRAVGHNPEPTAITFALIAELAQVDGKLSFTKMCRPWNLATC